MSSADTEFYVDSRSKRRAILGALLAGVPIAVFYLMTRGWMVAAGVFVLCSLSAFSLAWVIKPSRVPIVRFTDEAVFLYDPKKKHERRIPWRLLSGVRAHEMKKGEGFLEFNLGGFRQVVPLAHGAPSPEAIAAAISVRITAKPAEVRLSAADIFEQFFSVRLPADVSVVHEEYYAADGSGMWVVALPDADFKKLSVTAGRVTEWYPVTEYLRLVIGGRELRGTIDLFGEYTLSTDSGDVTPVLIYDKRRRRLIGALSPVVA